MADLNIGTDEYVKALSHTLGEQHAESISYKLLLHKAGETIDELLLRCARLEAELEHARGANDSLSAL